MTSQSSAGPEKLAAWSLSVHRPSQDSCTIFSCLGRGLAQEQNRTALWMTRDHDFPALGLRESPSGPPPSLGKPEEARHSRKERERGLQSRAALEHPAVPSRGWAYSKGGLPSLSSGEGAGWKSRFYQHEHPLPPALCRVPRGQRRCAPLP